MFCSSFVSNRLLKALWGSVLLLLRQAVGCPGRTGSTCAPCPSGQLLEPTTRTKWHVWPGVGRRCSKAGWPHANSADFNHTRSTALVHLTKVGAKSNTAAKRGFCPTEISALRTLASTPTFSIQVDTVKSLVKGGSFWLHAGTHRQSCCAAKVSGQARTCCWATAEEARQGSGLVCRVRFL